MSRGNSRVFAVPLAPGVIYTGGGVLFGWSVSENAGPAAPGTVVIRDGVDVSGPILAVIELPADRSDTESLGPEGLSFMKGIFVEITGTVRGSIYLG